MFQACWCCDKAWLAGGCPLAWHRQAPGVTVLQSQPLSMPLGSPESCGVSLPPLVMALQLPQAETQPAWL